MADGAVNITNPYNGKAKYTALWLKVLYRYPAGNYQGVTNVHEIEFKILK